MSAGFLYRRFDVRSWPYLEPYYAIPYLDLQCLVPQSATQPCNIKYALNYDLSYLKSSFPRRLARAPCQICQKKEVGCFIIGRLGYILNEKLCFWSGSRRVHCTRILCGRYTKYHKLFLLIKGNGETLPAPHPHRSIVLSV